MEGRGDFPPARSSRRAAASIAAPLAIAAALGSSACASLEAYSIRVAEKCESVSTCTVYDASGEHLSPCIPTGRQTIYPGDPRWPYTTPGVCDAVRDGKVVSTRELEPAPAP